MTQPSVTILITNFNYADFLPRCIESALSQDYAGSIEVVVVDDCSTDNSTEVISSYIPRIKAVMKSKNEGHGAAFNSGFAASTGELVVFLDADDYLYPSTVSRIVSVMESGASMYQYRLNVIDRAGTELDIHPPAEVRMEEGDVRPLLCSMGRFATNVTSGLAFPRWALNKIMPMPPGNFRQGGDGFLVTTAPLYGKVVTVPGILGVYCQHGRNHSEFALDVARRARWRLEHDEFRYKVLRSHAEKVGLTVVSQPGLSDFDHLVERLASLQLEPRDHPYPNDSALKLAPLGLRALRRTSLSVKRRWIMSAWWCLASCTPRPIAKPIITWKLAAASRPDIINRMAKWARALGRPSRRFLDASQARNSVT